MSRTKPAHTIPETFLRSGKEDLSHCPVSTPNRAAPIAGIVLKFLLGPIYHRNMTTCTPFEAVHLLSQGILAFKVSGIGAATDLVFPVPVDREIELVCSTTIIYPGINNCR